ncbi:MAG TPA: cytochrome c1 [Burkholderiales bacterium]|nr:cytochrome c1 [Burkholderiales bacterium]
MTKLLLLILLLPFAATAADEHVRLDQAPIDIRDAASLQRGAKIFVNYCLNCHSAQYMRYNRLVDIGLTDQQIRDNLMFASNKVGDTMTVAMRKADGAKWFGTAPPDLTVVARSRGPDWIYTYLRSYYRDDSTTTGWNNLVFPSVAMPHVLWELQGQQVLTVETHEGAHGKEQHRTLALASAGTLSSPEYDKLVADLVNYLVFMGEPMQITRTRMGYVVLMGLAVLFVLAYLLKKEYWKDVH